MPKNPNLAFGESVARFLWSLKTEFPQVEVAIGVPIGFKFEDSWSEEEKLARAEAETVFAIHTTEPLTDEQQAEIRRRVGEKFITFFAGTVAA